MPLPPLVLALLAFLAGLLPALRFAPPPLPFVCAALVLLVAPILWDPVRSARILTPELLLFAAFAAAGAGLGAARLRIPDCREHIPDRAAVRVDGLLGAASFPEEGEAPPLLPMERARVRGRGWECSAPVRLVLPPGGEAALAGARIHARGTWVPATTFSPSAWPRDGYRAGYIRADSVLSTSPPSLLRHPFLTLRGRSERLLRDLFPRHFALVEALLLGRRERLDPAVRDRFTRAGLSHLLAISGSHVAVLAGVLLLVGGALRLPRRRITWSTIVLVALYLVVIGAPASAVRAGAMVSLVLFASLLQRPSAILPIAAAACLLIVAVEPFAILDVGLQLSFAGVFGIMAAQRTLGRRLARATRGRPWRSLAETLLVSAAAFLATAPITAFHFGTVSPVAILANVPAIPLTGLALVGVLATVAAAPIGPLADLLAAGTGLSFDLLDRVATVAANAPYATATVERPNLGAWAAAGLLAAGAASFARAARPAIRASTGAAAVVAVLAAWPAVVRGSAGGGFEIHFLDVGQGDAIALRTPRGHWVLVDAGPRSTEYDAGERRVVPFFRARGVRRLEALVLTHPDADHIGGAPAVLRALRVERVIEPGVEVGKDLYLEVLDQVEGRGADWAAARSGRTLVVDGVSVQFLWPDAAAAARIEEANDASAVALVAYGSFRLLLPGDVSAEVEEALLRQYGPDLRASVLKAGHHGSSTSTSAEFLRVVDPELVVISAGRRNRYGHPSPDVVARVTGAGVRVARTDLEGTISLRVSPDPPMLWRRVGE